MYTGRKTLLTLIVIAAVMVCATLASAQTSGTPSEVEKRVTLQFKDVPIGNAIAILFEGINHVVQPGVQGSVTLVLNDVPFNDALQALLKAAGLTANKQNNVYYIGPQKEVAAETAAFASVVPETEVQVERSKIPEKIKIGYGDATEIGSYLGAQIGGQQRNQMMGGMGGGMMGGGMMGGGGMGGGYGGGMGGGMMGGGQQRW